MPSAPADSALHLKTLGPTPRLVSGLVGGGETLLFGPGKPLALLIYLSLLPDHTATRVHLTDLLWADSDLERARQSLRQAIWQVRRKLGDGALSGDGEQVRLRIPLNPDYASVGTALRNAQFEEAVRLYEGDFLGEFGVPGGAGFEHWADGVRERLRSGWMRALDALARERLNSGRTREAIGLIRRLRDADPANEAAWRFLFDSLLLAGDAVGAGVEADALESLLAAEQRVPEPQTIPFLSRVRTMPPPTTAAPSALTAELIGREAEFRRLTQAWARARAGEHQNLHLSAPAGLGKTRLLRDAERRLRAMGGRVLYLRAPPGSRQISYAFAAELARALVALPGAAGVPPAVIATILALDPSLASFYQGTPDTSEGAEALRHRTIALADLLMAAGVESPVALLLDDVHWMDRESLHAVAGLRSRVAGSPTMIVTAGRPYAGRLAVEPDAEVLHLPPLSEEQVEALVMSLGQLPEAAWSHRLVHRVQQAAGGSPHLILESLQLALDQGWLTLTDQGWECREPERIEQELPAGDAMRRRLDGLDEPSRDVVSLLAIAAAPLPAAVFAEAAGLPESEATALLAALEVRGFVTQGDDRWRIGHDALADAALRDLDPGAVRRLSARLGTALAIQPSMSTFDHQRAAELLVEAGQEHALPGLYQRWVAAARRLRDPRTDAELARALLGAATTPPRMRSLLRSRPVHRQLGLDSRQRRWGASGIGLLLLGAAALGVSRSSTRPTQLVLLQAPIAGNDGSIVPVPVVEVRDASGRRVRDGKLEIHAEVVGDSIGVLGETTAAVRDGIATFDRMTLPAGPGAVIRFTAPGLPAVETMLPGAEGATLWLDHAELNGQSLSSGSRTLVLAPGELISGVVTLRFSAYWAAASVIVGAFPTWGDRRENYQTVSALATPVIDAVTRRSLSIPGPTKAGEYFLVFAFAAETDARWIASGTNWAIGAPVWGDGNDLVDITAAQVAEANHTGHLRLEWEYTLGRNPTTLAATVIKVEVR